MKLKIPLIAFISTLLAACVPRDQCNCMEKSDTTNMAKLSIDTTKHTYAASETNENEYGFVNLSDIIPDAIIEMRYYGTYNFVGCRIDGYEEPIALLTHDAAKALLDVSNEVKEMGYRLKIFDAYRPISAVKHFVRWSNDAHDTLMKAYFYPNTDKSMLFRLGYISSHSRHSHGSTVDLTLFDMTTGKELDMGSTFDWLGVESHPGRTTGLTKQQYHNRMTLRKIMMKHGFKPCGTEWWHFVLINEPFPSKSFDFPVKTIRKTDNIMPNSQQNTKM